MNSLLATAHPYIVQYGYGALFGVLFVESLGLSVPGETFLVAASFLAVQGQLNIWLVVVTAWAAATLGDNVGYAIGRFGDDGLADHLWTHILRPNLHDTGLLSMGGSEDCAKNPGHASGRCNHSLWRTP